MKEPRVEKPKVQTQETTFFYHVKSIKISEKKSRIEKKKKRSLKYEQAWNNFGSTPITKVNTPNVTSTTRKDLKHNTCFNCDKKGHYAIKCPKSRNYRDASKD